MRFEPIDFGFAPEYGDWQFTFYDNYAVPVYTAVRNATAGDRGISVAFTVPTRYIDKSEIGTDALIRRRRAP